MFLHVPWGYIDNNLFAVFVLLSQRNVSQEDANNPKQQIK